MRYILATLLVCLLSLPTPADARNHRLHGHHVKHHRFHHDGFARHRTIVHRARHIHSTGRPRAWCGWYARSLVGSDPGIAFNLARNWARWGRPASPGIGVIVVWSHHVGMITGRTSDGKWIVKSGNDGHGVRERPRSIAGAIAFRAG